MRDLALVVIIIGIIFIGVGIFLWLGKGLHLPGDIVFKKGNFTFYFPLGTCVLISLILTLLFYFFRR